MSNNGLIITVLLSIIAWAVIIAIVFLAIAIIGEF